MMVLGAGQSSAEQPDCTCAGQQLMGLCTTETLAPKHIPHHPQVTCKDSSRSLLLQVRVLVALTRAVSGCWVSMAHCVFWMWLGGFECHHKISKTLPILQQPKVCLKSLHQTSTHTLGTLRKQTHVELARKINVWEESMSGEEAPCRTSCHHAIRYQGTPPGLRCVF